MKAFSFIFNKKHYLNEWQVIMWISDKEQMWWNQTMQKATIVEVL